MGDTSFQKIRQLIASALKRTKETRCYVFEPSKRLVGKSSQFQMSFCYEHSPASLLELFSLFILF